MIIREAQDTDINILSELMTHLGYPTTQHQMVARYQAISHHDDYALFVAEIEKQVVGMVCVMLILGVEQDGVYGRVNALIVDPQSRKLGVGQQLMKTAEDWATAHGANGMVLNSGNRTERQAAHQFYRAIGYEPKSTGFVKKLN